MMQIVLHCHLPPPHHASREGYHIAELPGLLIRWRGLGGPTDQTIAQLAMNAYGAATCNMQHTIGGALKLVLTVPPNA